MSASNLKDFYARNRQQDQEVRLERLLRLVGSTRTLTLADQALHRGLTPLAAISPFRPINIKRGGVQIAREK
jgi:hypothetical protein